MSYVDFGFYAGYTKRDPTVIDEDSWSYWEQQAEGEVDKRTFGRLRNDRSLISDDVKRCVCDIAEFLYKAETLYEQARQLGGAGPLTSFNNDGESGTFDAAQSPYIEENKAKSIGGIIYRHLAFSGLLYAGVRR